MAAAVCLPVSHARAAPGDVVASFAAPGDSGSGLGWDGSSLWVANLQTALGGGRNRVTRHDPATFVERSGFDMQGSNIHHGLAFDADGTIWTDEINDVRVLDTDVVQLDRAGNVLRRFLARGTIYGVALDPENGLLYQVDNHSVMPGGDDRMGEMWVLNPMDGRVVRGPVRIPVRNARGVAWDGEALWVASQTDRIFRVDAMTGAELASFAAPGDGGTEGIAWDGSCLWISDTRGDRVYRVDHGQASLPACTPLTIGADAGPGTGDAGTAAGDGGVADGGAPGDGGAWADAGAVANDAAAPAVPPDGMRRDRGCACTVGAPTAADATWLLLPLVWLLVGRQG